MCPFLNQEDPDCRVHLNLAHLEEAMGLCAHDYHACPIYQQKVTRHRYAVARTA
jgi:hypothetical protein